jgi:hypothetical protein
MFHDQYFGHNAVDNDIGHDGVTIKPDCSRAAQRIRTLASAAWRGNEPLGPVLPVAIGVAIEAEMAPSAGGPGLFYAW